MSEALDRILSYAIAFTKAIDRCRSASTSTFDAADWEDAYNRLNRLRDHYIHEKPYLNAAEPQTLRKVFDEDAFIKEMLDIRQIGEHVHKHGPSDIRLMTNVPIPICATTSAFGFFEAPIVRLPDVRGQLQPINHLDNLEKAEKRVQRALDRATNKLP